MFKYHLYFTRIIKNGSNAKWLVRSSIDLHYDPFKKRWLQETYPVLCANIYNGTKVTPISIAFYIKRFWTLKNLG